MARQTGTAPSATTRFWAAGNATGAHPSLPGKPSSGLILGVPNVIVQRHPSVLPNTVMQRHWPKTSPRSSHNELPLIHCPLGNLQTDFPRALAPSGRRVREEHLLPAASSRPSGSSVATPQPSQTARPGEALTHDNTTTQEGSCLSRARHMAHIHRGRPTHLPRTRSRPQLLYTQPLGSH